MFSYVWCLDTHSTRPVFTGLCVLWYFRRLFGYVCGYMYVFVSVCVLARACMFGVCVCVCVCVVCVVCVCGESERGIWGGVYIRQLINFF